MALLTQELRLDGREGAADWEVAHDRAVARLSQRTALALGFTPDRARQVHLAGLVHDIGKREIPREILDKPGPLDADEWRQMKLHPVVGQQILMGLGLIDIASWVRSHHERYDGGGYPDGIAGTDIPLEGRILAVTDAYHAMTSARPYSRPLSPSEAADELRRESGAQFDPEVVKALLGAIGHNFSCRGLGTVAAAA
jgi:HD-GYP domain-containing protein (c-di-GMP phosphodiesterase class II)